MAGMSWGVANRNLRWGTTEESSGVPFVVVLPCVVLSG